jgi:ankyrin repeat protein
LVETIRYLVQQGADIDAHNVMGHTGLMMCDNIDAVEALIELGADHDTHGVVESPLASALYSRDKECARVLARKSNLDGYDGFGFCVKTRLRHSLEEVPMPGDTKYGGALFDRDIARTFLKRRLRFKATTDYDEGTPFKLYYNLVNHTAYHLLHLDDHDSAAVLLENHLDQESEPGKPG